MAALVHAIAKLVANAPRFVTVPQNPGAMFPVTVLDVSTAGLCVSCPAALSAQARSEGTFLQSKVLGTTKYVCAQYGRLSEKESPHAPCSQSPRNNR